MYIYPDVPTLVRASDALQFGTTRGAGVVLSGLSPSEVEVLTYLRLARSRSRALDFAERRGVDAATLDAFVDTLTRAGVASRRHPTRHRTPLRWSGETQTASDLARKRVDIRGLSPVGARLALLLADAGIGGLALSDPAEVGPTDLPLLPANRLTDRRDQVLADMVRPRVGNVVTQPATRADLSVLISGFAPDPAVWAPIIAVDRPHLPIVISEGTIEVGPLVRPGHTACLHCVALARRDADPGWAALAPQLYNLPTPPVGPLAATRIAAFAATEITQILLDGPTAIEGRSWMFSPSDPVGCVSEWAPHPACACGASAT